MKFEMDQIISMAARKGHEFPYEESQLPVAIEYKTKQGVAISFYTADMDPSFFELPEGEERPTTLKFLEREAHAWRAEMGYPSNSEKQECKIPEEEILRFFEEQNVQLHGR